MLVLRLQGEVPEKPPVELPAFLGGDRAPVTVSSVWSTLEKAAADSHIQAVVVMPEGLQTGWGKLEEFRRERLGGEEA